MSAFRGDLEFPVTLTCEDEVKPLFLDLDSVTALGIVIAEIISNAYVHAFPGRAGGLVLVRRLMEQIGGSVRIVLDPGTKWALAFPMAAERVV